MGELAHDAVVDSFVEDEVAVGVDFHGIGVLFAQVLVGGKKDYFAVVGRLDGGVGIHIDGGVEDGTAIDVGIWGDVGAAAGETESEWCFASDDHD